MIPFGAKFPLAFALSLVAATSAGAASPGVQSRDHLTHQEIELVQGAQILNKRIEVFIKAAERRLMVLTGKTPVNTKQLKKESELWGEWPTGTRGELLGDIAKILDEAITNIDDVSRRDEKNVVVPNALRRLAAASKQILDQVRPFGPQAKTEEEISNLEQAMQNAQSVIDAANKLPPPTVDKTEKAKDEKP